MAFLSHSMLSSHPALLVLLTEVENVHPIMKIVSAHQKALA
jgi:hypothetical protein